MSRAAFDSWLDHRTLRVGAGLAYYALFGIVPFLSLSVYLANLAFSTEEVRRRMEDAVEAILGTESSRELADALGGIIGDPTVGSSTGVVGLITLVAASALVLAALQDAIDVIFEVPVERSVSHTVRRRLFLFALVLVLASAILATLVLESIVGALLRFLVLDRLGLDPGGFVLSTRLVSLALIVGVVLVLYRLLPRAKPPWRVALLGAVIVTGIGTLATLAVALYLRTIGSGSLEGVAGGIVLVLTLVFAWCQVFLAGAELIRVLASEPAPVEDGIAEERTKGS